MRIGLKTFCVSAVIAVIAIFSQPAWADSCTDLASAHIDGATVTAATGIPAGQFTTPNQVGYGSVTLTVPAFCRVQLDIGTATAEVWLPAAWNNKLNGWGNGGELGAIIYYGLYYGLVGGYVSVSSDLGHQSGNEASWALNHPHLIKEFGRTATHDMTLAAKALTQLYYGTAPVHSYFIGGSAGGRQALMEAEKYPTDYDGIASLYPGQTWTHIMAGMIAQELKLGGSGTSDAQISYDQSLALNRAVLNACDGLDGLKDGLIEDPTQCQFDPAVMACGVTHTRRGCMSDIQIAAVRALYQPLRLSSGKLFYPGLPYGSEYEWSCSVLHDAFYAAGGKLLIAQGQSDAVVVPENTVNYYRDVKQRYGSGTEGFARLFMMPGVGHCATAVGPGSWDIYGVLSSWVEKGIAPDSIIAYQYNGDGSINRSRPLCPWPKKAHYYGRGDVNDARNFTCKD